MRRQNDCPCEHDVTFDNKGVQGAPRTRGSHHDDERWLLHLDAQDDSDGLSALPNPDNEVTDVPRGYLP